MKKATTTLSPFNSDEEAMATIFSRIVFVWYKELGFIDEKFETQEPEEEEEEDDDDDGYDIGGRWSLARSHARGFYQLLDNISCTGFCVFLAYNFIFIFFLRLKNVFYKFKKKKKKKLIKCVVVILFFPQKKVIELVVPSNLFIFFIW